MIRRLLNPNLSSSQKEDNRRSSPHHRKHCHAIYTYRAPLSPPSPCHHKWISLHSLPPSSSPRVSRQDDMPIFISPALRRWLHDKSFGGYIRVAEVPPHPDAQEVAKKLNVDTITNASIRKKLGLSGSGERHFEITPVGVLERYFGEYSTSSKAYKTRDIPNPFFGEVAKFLL